MVQESMYSKKLIEKRSNEIIGELKNKGISGIDRFVRRLKIASDDEECLDILAQGRFALILSGNGFSRICIEPKGSLPDIIADSDNYTSYWEVKRRRPKEEDNIIAESEGAWLVSPDSDESIKDLVVSKLGQLLDGEINVIVVWSNTIKVGIADIQESAKYMSKEIQTNPGVYKKLSGFIFVEDQRVDLKLPDEIYLFVNYNAQHLLPKPLIEKLRCFCRCICSIQRFLS